LNGLQFGRERVLHFYFRHLELMFQEGEGVRDYFIHVHISDFAAAGAREIEQVVYDFRGAESLPRDFLQQPGLLWITLQLLRQHLGVGGDHGQGCIDFVRYAGCEQSNR